MKNLSARLPAFLIILMLAALLEGCVQEKPAAEDMLKKMHEKYSSISSYKATLYQKEISDGQETCYQVAVKKPDRAMVEHVSSGVATILNGSEVWIYNKNTGETKEFTYQQTSYFLDFFGYILDMLKDYNASLAGEEKVGGRDCYILSLKLARFDKSDKSPQLEKLWIVKDEWYPARVQMRIEFSEDAEKFGINFSGSTVIFELRNVEFNTSVDDAEFLPPEKHLNLSALSDEEVVGLALNTSELEIYRGWNYTIREKRIVGDSLCIDMYFGRNGWRNAVHVSFYVQENGSLSHIRIYPYVKTVIPVAVRGEDREKILNKALNDSHVRKIIAGRDYYIWLVSRFINPITGEKYDEYSVYLRLNATNETYVIYIQDGQINVRNATCHDRTGWWC